MRIIYVWIVGIFLITVTLSVWYITQPILIRTFAISDATMEANSWNTSQWEQTNIIGIYLSNLWPIPIVLVLLLWMFMSAQREDPYSQVYGGY